MKAIFAVFTLLTLAPSAFAAFNYDGQFYRPHDIAFTGYSAAECEEEGGRWQENGVCYLGADDGVIVTRNGANFRLQVSTISTNAHTCDFEGRAALVSPRELRAQAPTEEYVPGENGGEGMFVPAVCELKVSYLDDNIVSVSLLSRPATCASLCGFHAELAVPAAYRQ